jgi:transcriptional regulator with XRE-family HTH domain
MFAQKLKALRLKQGLTQAQLGARLGVSASAVGMYEQGRREPDSTILMRMCEVFEVDANYLLCGARNEDVAVLRLEDMITQMRERLLSQQALMFHGKPIDAEGAEKIIAALELGAQLAAEYNQKKRGEEGG